MNSPSSESNTVRTTGQWLEEQNGFMPDPHSKTRAREIARRALVAMPNAQSNTPKACDGGKLALGQNYVARGVIKQPLAARSE